MMGNVMAGGVGAAAGAYMGHQSKPQGTLIVVFTDGHPSDGLDNFYHLMKTRDASRFPISFVACTDKASDVSYLNKLDKQCKFVDTTDDYESERQEIRRSKGKDLSFGDYLCKALCGPTSALDKYDGF